MITVLVPGTVRLEVVFVNCPLGLDGTRPVGDLLAAGHDADHGGAVLPALVAGGLRGRLDGLLDAKHRVPQKLNPGHPAYAVLVHPNLKVNEEEKEEKLMTYQFSNILLKWRRSLIWRGLF